MIVVGAVVAVILGGLAGVGLNRLAAWLLARDVGPVANRPYTPFKTEGPTRPRELALVAATALVAAALWLCYGASWQLLPAAIAGLLLLLIAAIDLDCRLVLNEVVLVGAALALLHAVLVGSWGGLLISLAGGGVGFGLFLLVAVLGRLVFGTGALGAGDVKLAGLLGLMFGFPAVMRCLLLGVICGGLISGGLLLTRRLERKTMIPYAPFLVVGGIITLLTG